MILLQYSEWGQHCIVLLIARKGDIYRVIVSGVKTIILIDGVFHSTPSVWQRELLQAMEEGIRVLGASSMGALRAAELHPFSMIGYGTHLSVSVAPTRAITEAAQSRLTFIHGSREDLEQEGY